MDKTKVVNVRLSEETLIVIRTMAEEKKIPISTQIREIIEMNILPEILALKVKHKALNFIDTEEALYEGSKAETEYYLKRIEEYSEYIGKAFQEGEGSIQEIKRRYESLSEIIGISMKKLHKTIMAMEETKKQWHLFDIEKIEEVAMKEAERQARNEKQI